MTSCTRATLMPPDVEPEQPPMNASMIIRIGSMPGQCEKPVLT